MLFRLQVLVFVFALGIGGFSRAQGQDDPVPPSPSSSPTGDSAPPTQDPTTSKRLTPEQLKEADSKLLTQTKEEVSKIAKTIDQDPRAKTAAAGILQPIYAVAESLAFPAFHWLAFALMTAGVISYALQLVLGKLIVLMRMGFSLKEILSDAVGLAISVFGLVLTTQAAAENSTFTQSPAAVISATVVGALAGIILYRWGQSEELEAAAGRSRTPATKKR